MFICIYVYIYFFPDFSLCIRSISSQADSEDFVKSMKSFLENHPMIQSLHLESNLLESGKLLHEIISVKGHIIKSLNVQCSRSILPTISIGTTVFPIVFIIFELVCHTHKSLVTFYKVNKLD